MMPTPVVSEFAWRQIARELDRVAPAEGLLVPLVALRPRDPEQNPCAMLELEAIDQVIIASVLLVPRERQENRLTRVSVLPQTDELIGARIETQVTRFPRLRACAHLHSHPFATGHTRPSAGDIDGHLLPLWHSNQSSGLNTSFSFIACRQSAARGWRLHCFAVDRRGAIVDLGPTRVVPNTAPAVTFALHPALHRQPVARALLRHWRRRQRRRGRRVSCDELFGGWRRLVARDSRGQALVLLVPLDFPNVQPRRYAVVGRGDARAARPLGGSWLADTTEDLDERA